jgi:hypothetical protein
VKRFLAVAITFGALAAAFAPRHACALKLVYSNDVLGEVEPCGCRTNPYGGMVRKARLIETLAPEPLLQLDAGDLLFATDVVPELLKKQAEIQAGYVLKAMDMLHHDAVVPGEKDFALGIKTFDQLRKGSKTRFLAANLVRSNGSNYLPDSHIFTRKGSDGKDLRIAVIGLGDPSLAWPKGLKALSPIEVAREEIPKLRKKADLVIALTHEGFEKDIALAKAVKGIDVIVGGHSQSFLQNPPQINGTWIYQSSFRNQYIGLVSLAKPFKPGDHRLVGLDPGYDPPDVHTPLLSEMRKLVEDFKTDVARANSQAEQATLSRAEPVGDFAKYETFPRCAECHWKQFDFWRSTPHARALTPLVEKHQLRNKECLTCHTVGLGDPQGWSSLEDMARLKAETGKGASISPEQLAAFLQSVHDASNLKTEVRLTPATPQLPVHRAIASLGMSYAPVQCENCHGAGMDHPFSNTSMGKVPQDTCLKCHTAERAPEWYTGGKPDWTRIDEKRKQITCPAGDLDPTAN